MPKAKSDIGTKTIGNVIGRDPNDVIIIGLDTQDGPEHPLFDGPSNARDLTESGVAYAYEHGISDPVFLVRDGEKVLVLKGRKRTKELREANAQRIAAKLPPHLLPTIIKPGSYEKEGMRRDRVVENWGLRNERTAIEKAQEAQELLDHNEMTEEQICDHLGIKKAQLKNHLALQQLGAKAAEAVNSGRITPSAALPLTKLPVKEQNEKLEEILASAPPGKRPTLERVRKATGATEIQTPKVRLAKAADQLTAIAADLGTALAGIPEDDPIWSALSAISHALTGQTWNQLLAPVDQESTDEQVARALSV